MCSKAAAQHALSSCCGLPSAWRLRAPVLAQGIKGGLRSACNVRVHRTYLLKPPAVWVLAYKCCKFLTMLQRVPCQLAWPNLPRPVTWNIAFGRTPLPEVIHQAFSCGNGAYWSSEGLLCRAEWHEWAQKPDEVDDDYAMRIRMTFTFSVEGVPAHLRQKDFHTDGRSAAKQGAFPIVLPAPLGGSQQRGMCPANKRLRSMVCIVFPLMRMCSHT